MTNLTPTPEPSLKPTVLVVEDNETNARLAQIILERGGYRVVIVMNGWEAVEAAKRQMFDVILMDVQMPLMDGFDATRAIRRLAGSANRVPIIALTASVMSSDTRHCLEAGMDDSVGKPFKREELIEKCQYWMNRRPMTSVHYAEVVSQ